MQEITNMVRTFTKALTRTPLYPYWLIFEEADRGNSKLLKSAHGLVLNIGSGADDKRQEVEDNPKVRTYITLDYPAWGKNFQQLRQNSEIFGNISTILYRHVTPNPNIWGDGYNVPFLNNCIDTVVSLGVLEHIADPIKFLTEHYRVLKPHGVLLMTTPLLYQSHGGTPAGSDDYIRYTEYGLKHILHEIGFSDIDIRPYGSFGTALTQLINSYIIKRTIEKPRIIVYMSMPILAILFFFVNLFGYCINYTGSDPCYTAGFFVRAKARKLGEKSMTASNWEKLLRCPQCKSKLSYPTRCTVCDIPFIQPKYGRVYLAPTSYDGSKKNL